MTEANPSLDPQSASPLSANLPHRPADDTEEVYYEGSPVLRGAIFKGFLWILVGLVLIAAPIVAKVVFHQSVGPIGFAVLIVAGFTILSVPIIQATTLRYR